MRRVHRIVLLAGLVALAPVLSGCEDFDMDKFDIFHLNEKKKLPGERKELFPQGVPGVSQGVPSEYLKGNQPPPDVAQTPPPAGAAGATPPAGAAAGAPPAPKTKTAVVEPAPKLKPAAKPKPKRNAKVRKPAQPAAQAQAQQPAQAPGGDQQKLAPWPGAAQQQPPAGQKIDPWTSAPAPGTFSR